MNRREHRFMTIESVISEPAPRTRVTCFVDGRMVQLRVSKGKSHHTVNMSGSAFEYLASYVTERLREGGSALKSTEASR